MFKAIGQILGKVFGTAKAVEHLVDKDSGLLVKVGSWVGGLNYTEEEKAEMDMATRKWGLTQLEALAPFKVVQRIIAFAVTGLWGFVGANVVAAIWVDALTAKYVEINGAVVQIAGTRVAEKMLTFALSDYVFWPVLAVLGLYFTGGVIPTRK